MLSRICCDLRPQSSTPFHHHHPLLRLLTAFLLGLLRGRLHIAGAYLASPGQCCTSCDPENLLASSKAWPQKHPRCSSQNAVVLWRLASEVRSAGTQGGWRFPRSSEDIGGLAAKLSQPPQCPAKLLLFIIHTHPKHVPCWAPSRCIASRCICCNQQGRCLFTSNPGRKIRPQANKNPEKHQESPRVTRIPNSIKITKPFCYRSSCLPNYPPTICLWLP